MGILRAGGYVPVASRALPTYLTTRSDGSIRREVGLLPLGLISTTAGPRFVGVPLDTTLFAFLAGASGCGKALASDTPIPTPSGWTTMGKLQAGDQVFDEAGQPCRVVFATEVMEGHECFELVFSDGSSVVADADHQWMTWTAWDRGHLNRWLRRERRGQAVGVSGRRGVARHTQSGKWVARGHTVAGVSPYLGIYSTSAEAIAVREAYEAEHPAPAPKGPHARVRTTRELQSTLRAGKGEHANHAVAVCGPLQYPARELPIDPYVLGVWVGDGHSAEARVTVSDQDAAILEEIRAAGIEVRPVRQSRRTPTYTLRIGPGGGQRPGAKLTWSQVIDIRAAAAAGASRRSLAVSYRVALETIRLVVNGLTWKTEGEESVQGRLRRLGLLGSKHIPRLYLEASPAQRLALLQGLMDTDGSALASGACEFSSKQRELAGGVLELIVGLGMKAVLRRGRAQLYGQDCGERFRVGFTPSLPVFRLGRKLARLRLEKPSSPRRFRYVVAVRSVPTVPVKCVAVDSPSRLYLAGRSCIPTHNTTLSMVQALHLSTVEHMGILFVDPTYGAVRRLKPYLAGAGPAVHRRVVEIDFSGLGGRPQPGWNLFDVAGLHPAQVVGRSAVIAEAFLAASGWDRTMAPRASNLLMQAAQSLTELSTILVERGRDDIQPTVFQIVSILTKEDWRRAVTPYLSQPLKDFWQNRLEGFEKTAIPPATNLLDTMRHMPGIVNVLGQSRSGFLSRRAMDQGQIALICTGPGEAGKLAANLVVFDALRAALSRADVPEAERQLFGVVLDELQRYDMREVSQILNELRQFGIRAIGVTQDPDRLEEDTLKALLTNASHLLIGRENPTAAAMFARQWSGAPAAVTLTKLPNHTFVGVVNLADGRQPPFRFQTPALDEVFGDMKREDLVDELNRTVRGNTRWQSAADVERHQRHLDDAILSALSGSNVVRLPVLHAAESEAGAMAAAGLERVVIPRPEDFERCEDPRRSGVEE